ncbi:MAG: ABC transporter ATP-binding protein [Alphaproteobacteria bacterium]|nr:ABC transporter ATP-binding protein [Alphaproteobacteria bacterium]
MNNGMRSTGSALEIQDLSHTYDGRRAVDGVSLRVEPGEVVCLLGPSGCGKTTVLRLVAGLEKLQAGRILVGDQVVAEPGREAPPEARGVGLVFQDLALFPHLDIGTNVGFGLRRLSAGERNQRVEALLRRLHLEGYSKAWPHQLSGGQQQRAALARAIAPAPGVVLMDEPFSGLDARLRGVVRDEALHLLKADRMTALVVTHDPEEAMFMADRIAVMRAGKIVQVGRPRDVYTRPATEFVAEFLGDVNRIDGVTRGGRVETPFGPLLADGFADGQGVHVLIRPEALRLAGVAAGPGAGPTQGAVKARVLAARLLGRTSWVHFCLNTDPTHRHDATAAGNEEHSHWHARVPGQFLPEEGTELAVSLDAQQAFVFAVGDTT